MTGITCSVANCTNTTASAYSPHCKRHKSTLRRHGAPDQRGVSKAELAPYIAIIATRIAKNPDSEAWPLLEAAWSAIVSDAQIEINRRIGNRYQRRAADELVAIALDSPPQKVVTTVLAMIAMWADRPRRFASDDALRVQLARRLRALSQRHVGLRYAHRTGRQVRVYRELAPKAAIIMGQKMMTAFGGIGLQLAALEERDRNAAQQAKQRLATAINKLN